MLFCLVCLCIVVLCNILSVEHLNPQQWWPDVCYRTLHTYLAMAQAISNTDGQLSISFSQTPACLLQLQNVLSMFNSKDQATLSSYNLAWDASVSITNVEHEPDWHHSRRLHQGSFPPTSLLVLALTRRHANRDTRLKPTGDLACQMGVYYFTERTGPDQIHTLFSGMDQTN